MDLRTKSTILIVALVALGLTGCAKQDSISVAHNELGKFYNWSTVEWAGIDSMYYRPLEQSDLGGLDDADGL